MVSEESTLGIQARDIGSNQDNSLDLGSSPKEKELSTQAVLPEARGFIAFIRHKSSGTDPWLIFSFDQVNNVKLKVYEGNREIDSVAISEDGNTVYFTAREVAGDNTSDFEVYSLDIDGGSTTQLTNTPNDELNVSTSADASIVAWDRLRSSTNLQSVYIREYDGSSYTQSFLDQSDNQLQPSVSSFGDFVILKRSLSNGNSAIKLYDRINSNYTHAGNSTNNLEHP